MSGRLVILPHKSWNVWNQDNREKVLRDERRHREEEEAKEAKEKQLLQEQNLELLRSTGEVSGLATEKSEAVVAPFRLFGDLEKKHFDQLGNNEYLKEKAARELAQKKREGIADWALGEGSYENSKTKPWYATRNLGASDPPPSSSGKTPALDREKRRKETADPMGSILVPNKLEYVPKEAGPPMLPECPPVESIESKEEDASTHGSSGSESSKHDRKHKKRKRDKAERKEHKRKSRKHHSEGKDHDRSDNGSNGKTADPWAELRQKRLEREAVERKRAALLLAERDIYGPAGGTGGGSGSGAAGYSQQYNPHLARNNRW